MIVVFKEMQSIKVKGISKSHCIRKTCSGAFALFSLYFQDYVTIVTSSFGFSGLASPLSLVCEKIRFRFPVPATNSSDFHCGNWSCFDRKHRRGWPNLDKVGEFGKYQSEKRGTCHCY